MLNTAIEYSWNKLHPEMHEAVGKIKDIAAGAVLLIGLFSYLSIIVIFYTSF
jgi:diacylglycerol kinase